MHNARMLHVMHKIFVCDCTSVAKPELYAKSGRGRWASAMQISSFLSSSCIRLVYYFGGAFFPHRSDQLHSTHMITHLPASLSAEKTSLQLFFG